MSFDIRISPLGVYPPEIAEQVNKRYKQKCSSQHSDNENLGTTLFFESED